VVVRDRGQRALAHGRGLGAALVPVVRSPEVVPRSPWVADNQLGPVHLFEGHSDWWWVAWVVLHGR